MQATKTTFHLTISRGSLALAHIRAYLAQRDPLALLAVVVVTPIMGLALGTSLSRAQREVPAVIPTALPAITIIATAQAEARPAVALDRAAAALPTATPRLVVAFDSPNGTAFPDPIPQPDPSMWIARWGDGWIEVQWAPHPIWIRAADIGANLADVRPMPAVVIAPVAEVAPEQPSYQVANESSLPLPADMRDQTEAQRQAYRDSIGLTDADMARSLAAHQAQQAASCDRDNDQGAYCQAVKAWLEAHR